MNRIVKGSDLFLWYTALGMTSRNINRVAPLLNELLHLAIVDSVKFVTKRCQKNGTKPQEPDFVASLTLNFTPKIFNILKTLFETHRFSVTGVFCHQKPLADIGASISPEIGDIIFVYAHTNKAGEKRLNSLLFQAKISMNTSATIAFSDEHQLNLYTKWPAFTYKKAGKLNGLLRDILPKAVNDGAQYLMIDNHPIYGLAGIIGTFPMGCATPAKTLHLNNSLSSELINFFKFKSGRTFEENPTITKDDWTKMVWDILEATRAKASNRGNIGLKAFPRQSIQELDGYCTFKTDGNSIYKDLHNNLGNKEINENEATIFDEDNISPSVILIESYEQDDNE